MRTHHRGHVAQCCAKRPSSDPPRRRTSSEHHRTRQALPHLPLPGAQGVYPAVQEHVYRQLGWLQKAGVVERVASAERDAMWTLTPRAPPPRRSTPSNTHWPPAQLRTTPSAFAQLPANREGR